MKKGNDNGKPCLRCEHKHDTKTWVLNYCCIPARKKNNKQHQFISFLNMFLYRRICKNLNEFYHIYFTTSKCALQELFPGFLEHIII
jgi:hypothetical protein